MSTLAQEEKLKRSSDKNKKSKSKSDYYYIYISLVFLGIIIINYFLKNIVLISLNENQILYTYATTAQVIGGIFALTLTGYIYYNDKLNKMYQDDESLFDVVEKLKGDYFKRVLVLSIGCIVSIGLSLICINFKASIIDEWYHFFLNFAIFIFFLEIFLIVKFSIEMVNPNSINKANLKLLEANKYDSTNSNAGSLQQFLADYNAIENILMELTEEYFTKNMNPKFIKGKKSKPGLVTALKILNSMSIINDRQLMDLNEMRMYRNSVVHSENPTISLEAEERIKSLKEEIEKIIRG